MGRSEKVEFIVFYVTQQGIDSLPWNVKSYGSPCKRNVAFYYGQLTFCNASGVYRSRR